MIKSKKLTTKLTASEFSDSEFMTAKEKLNVAKKFEHFVVARLNLDPGEMLQGSDYGHVFKPWTRALYLHFSNHLGHIAHYDIHGFFHEQWYRWEDFVRNMDNLAAGRDNMGFPLVDTASFNSARTAYNDVNSWLQKVAEAYMPDVVDYAKAERLRLAQLRSMSAQQELEEALKDG